MTPREESMARHPAGKGIVADAKVVYTTATGEEPRGGPSLTDEATTPVPPPVKKITKPRVKKHTPRHRPERSVTELHTDITVDPRVMAAAKAAMKPGQRLVIVDAECVRLVNA